MPYMNPLNSWANTGDTTAPDTSKINLGWIPGEQPPAPWLNFMTNRGDNKINDIITFVNKLVGALTVFPTETGSEFIQHPPTPFTMFYSGFSWGDIAKSVYDQLNTNERLCDIGYDQRGGSWPGLFYPDSLFGETLWSGIRPRVGGAAQTDPKNTDTEGNYWALHDEVPVRMRAGTVQGTRVLLSGYKKAGGGGSDPMLRVTDQSYDFSFDLTYQEFMDAGVIPGPILLDDIDLEDFCIDRDYVYIQVIWEDPASPGTFSLFVASLKIIDKSWDPNTSWPAYKTGAGGGFSRLALGTNPKIERCSLEYIGNQRIVSVASYATVNQGGSGFVRVLNSVNGGDISQSNASLGNDDYFYAGICSDGEYLYAPINEDGSPNVRVISFEIADTTQNNPSFPVTPTTDNIPTCCIKSDGHFIIFVQFRKDNDDLLVMKRGGEFAKVGMLDFDTLGGGTSTPIVSLTFDGSAFWGLAHTAGGGPDGLHVRLVRLDPAAIYPGTQYLKDLQYRSFFIDTEVSLDWQYMGELLFTGREIIINWTQDDGSPDKGFVSRFANAYNR